MGWNPPVDSTKVYPSKWTFLTATNETPSSRVIILPDLEILELKISRSSLNKSNDDL